MHAHVPAPPPSHTDTHTKYMDERPYAKRTGFRVKGFVKKKSYMDGRPYALSFPSGLG
jgi:hypothetical protein